MRMVQCPVIATKNAFIILTTQYIWGNAFYTYYKLSLTKKFAGIYLHI